jgi:very-short-patch-repair endonuclease
VYKHPEKSKGNSSMSNNPAPTLSEVLKTVVQGVTGEQIDGAIAATHSSYATTRRTHSSIGTGRELMRTASMGGGVNTTAPSFYTPFTTPSASQIPNNRKEVYLWAQWWYDNEPKVAAGIDFYTDFPLSGFKLECDNGYVKDYFENMVKVLNFPKWLPLLSHEYHLRGDVFLMSSIDCQHCHGTNIDEDTDDRCEHQGARWRSLSILNPDMIEVTTTFLDSQPDYFYVPDDAMMKVVTEQKPKELYDSLPDKLKAAILSREPIKLEPEAIWQMKHGSAAFQPFGTSLIRRLFPTLAYKDKLRQAQWLVAERHILPIKIVKVGSEDRPASEDDLQAVQDEITLTATDPLLTIVTHHAFEFEYIGACHDDQTEVLTQSGFRKFADVSFTDQVACYDAGSGQMQWHTPQDKHEHDYDSSLYGPMLHFSGKHMDVAVTRNHDMLARKRVWDAASNRYTFAPWGKTPASSITDHDKFLCSVGWEGQTPGRMPYADVPLLSDVSLMDYLALAGYYLSEGSQQKHTVTRKSYAMMVYQKSGTPSQQRIDALWTRCFGDKGRSRDVSVNGYEPVTHFKLNSAVIARHFESQFGHGSENKSVPRWILDLPKAYLQNILDALMDGDGDTRVSDTGTTRSRYSTTSALLADAVQEIVFKLGFNPKVKTEARRQSHHLDIYRVYWASESEHRTVKRRNISEMEYQGKVYCLTVPTGLLVTRRNGQIAVHGNSGKVLQLTNEYELIDQEIIDGLMLNKAIINGDGPSYSNAQVGLLTMSKRLERFRDEVAYWIEERLFRPCAKWNGFTQDGKRGQEELIYPKIKWDDLQLRDDSGKLQVMATLQQAGVISSQTMVEELDIDWDQEVMRLRFEQGSGMVNSPDISGSDSSIGGGFRGSLGAPAPMGGAEGGAPPIGGADAGMGAPPGMSPAASTDDNERLYRTASSVSNGIADRVAAAYDEKVGVRLAGKQFKSAAHEGFIKSMRPADGRGYCGHLPDYDDIEVFPLLEGGPRNGGVNAEPQNRLAMQEDYSAGMVRTAAKSPQGGMAPSLFTQLEQELYKIILGMNVPYAFFAQYQAGPGQQYQLDGAFPAIKLGIEADSETYHSAPEKVASDRRRDQELMTQGWAVLRFTEDEIKVRQEEIRQVVFQAIRKLAGGGSGQQPL